RQRICRTPVLIITQEVSRTLLLLLCCCCCCLLSASSSLHLPAFYLASIEFFSFSSAMLIFCIFFSSFPAFYLASIAVFFFSSSVLRCLFSASSSLLSLQFKLASIAVFFLLGTICVFFLLFFFFIIFLLLLSVSSCSAVNFLHLLLLLNQLIGSISNCHHSLCFVYFHVAYCFLI
ncbi:hypothetical protein LINPERPRIM_LOCUS17782, partial [Linum perenne]